MLNRVDAIFDRALSAPWISYAIIFALQLKNIWGMWWWKDLTTGDTSSYFMGAMKWADQLQTDIVWSPLYLAYYGTNLLAWPDVYSATIAHRCLIVLGAAMCVLAVMRSLLPPAIALLVAAWWAMLPINFNTLYEVHLFALVPVLAAWLVVIFANNTRGRAAALAILLAGSFLVRNELIIAFGAYAVVCAVTEYRERGDKSWGGVLLSYAVAIAVAGFVCGFFVLRHDPSVDTAAYASMKHTLNMCQVYAFGYQQRNPEWTASPWTECYSLMKTTFGKELPTLGEMIRANPLAVAQHMAWNLSLTPNGLQTSLFNVMAGKVNPDYAPVLRFRPVLLVTIAAVTLVIVAGLRLYRNWGFWWSTWFRQRAQIWMIMLIVLCIAVPVIMTQRPRPSYLFSTTITLMAILGTSAMIVTWNHVTAVKRAVLAVLVLAFLVPPFFYLFKSDRPLFTAYSVAAPFNDTIRKNSERVYFGEYDGELRNYFRIDAGAKHPGYDNDLIGNVDKAASVQDYLDARQIGVFLIQPLLYRQLAGSPAGQRFLANPGGAGWRVLATKTRKDATWMLLEKSTPGQP
jgi:hypothetical protein